jgi:hypothetical protein
MIWREKRVLLIILGVLLLANAAFFFTYRVQYENRLQDLNSRLDASEARLQHARAARIAAQQQIDLYRKTQNDIQTLYNERWSTEAERFTALVSEIKKVTAACQLVPKSLAFSEAIDAPTSGTRAASGTGTAVVHIGFSVQGTYQQARRLINLLELSDQFVIIDAISLGGGGANDQNLTLNLRLKTIFRDTQRLPMMNKQL